MTLEIVTFKTMPGIQPSDVLQLSHGVTEFLQACPGFQSRELLYDAESGQWADTVRWADRASANAAGERIMSAECAAGFMALIDESTLAMHHLEPAGSAA